MTCGGRLCAGRGRSLSVSRRRDVTLCCSSGYSGHQQAAGGGAGGGSSQQVPASSALAPLSRPHHSDSSASVLRPDLESRYPHQAERGAASGLATPSSAPSNILPPTPMVRHSPGLTPRSNSCHCRWRMCPSWAAPTLYFSEQVWSPATARGCPSPPPSSTRAPPARLVRPRWVTLFSSSLPVWHWMLFRKLGSGTQCTLE